VRYDRDVADVDVPKTLRGIVASRIAKLGPTERYVLQVASLIGERFHLDLVAAAAQETLRVVGDALQAPDMRGIVAARGPGEHVFAHELVRQVSMESVPLDARKEIHGRLAEAIPRLYPDRVDELADRLARHHQEAGHDDLAVEYMLRATDRLEAEGAIEGAVNELRRAIDVLWDAEPKRRAKVLDLYARIADLCFGNRDFLAGATHMERALKAAEALRSPVHVARFHMWRGRMLVSASRIEEGRRWLDQAQHVARGLTDWTLSRDVLMATADAEARAGDFDKAIGMLREALQLARSAPDALAEVKVLMPLVLTYARMGEQGTAQSLLAQAMRLGEARGEAALTAQLHRLESQVCYHARDQEGCARAAAKALEIAREAGLTHEAALNAHNMGEAYLRLGDHRRAFAALRGSYEMATENGFTRLQMSNLRALGFIDATRFGSAEGRTRVVQAIEYAEQHDFVWDAILGKFFLAVIEHRRGETEEARQQLREVLNLAAQHGHRNAIEDAETALRHLDAGAPLELPR
jgi:tetratricopeptide (TPR) repeat protein